MSGLPGLFVVGTDTGVGKTFVASAIARAMTAEGRRVGVFKPAITGVPESDRPRNDADILIEAAGGVMDQAVVCPWVFSDPLAPPVAARRAGIDLRAEDIFHATDVCLEFQRWPRGAEVMVVEGVGGLLCPLAEGITVADLAVRLDYPLVVVARRGLGTLNHTLLTVEAALSRSLRVAGVVLNGAEPTVDPVAEATNPAELARRLGRVPILANVPHAPDAGASAVALEGLDWYNRAGGPRLPLPPST